MQPFLYGGVMSGDEVATGFVTFSVRVPAHLKVKLGVIAVRLGVAEAEVLRRLLERAVVPDEVLPVVVESPVSRRAAEIVGAFDAGEVPRASFPTGRRPLERSSVMPIPKKKGEK